MVYETTPLYLSGLVPPFNQQAHHYTTRQYLHVNVKIRPMQNQSRYEFLLAFSS